MSHLCHAGGQRKKDCISVRKVVKVGVLLKRWYWVARKTNAGKCRETRGWSRDLNKWTRAGAKVEKSRRKVYHFKKQSSVNHWTFCCISNSDVLVYHNFQQLFCFVGYWVHGKVSDLLPYGVWIWEGAREMTQRRAIKTKSL